MLFGIKMKRTKGNIGWTMLLVALLLSATVCMLTACSSDDTNTTSSPTNNPSEIRMNANVWQVMEGTRATIINPGAVNGSFMVYAYYSTTTENYINGEIVNYSGGVSSWVNSQFWPKDRRSLDFFAYMPTDLANTYCSFDYTAYDAESNSDGYSAGNPRIVCANLPMTYDSDSPTDGQGSNLKELVYAVKTGQSEASNSAGVELTFKRPFARITMQLSSAQEDIHINSITFKGIKNNGSCSFDGSTSTWTLSGDAADFVATLNGNNYQANDVIGTFIMIPQGWAGEIEVNADWTVWGVNGTHTVTATVPTTWVAGRSYTYTFTISETDLKVDTEKFTEQW